jgi:hypothetical protein
MTEKEKLVKYLTNLKNSGKTVVTVNIDNLLSILSEKSLSTPSPKLEKVDVDGGSFR